jgi:hypothetical protein
MLSAPCHLLLAACCKGSGAEAPEQLIGLAPKDYSLKTMPCPVGTSRIGSGLSLKKSSAA